MAASDADVNEMLAKSSPPDTDKRRPAVETSKSPGKSKHHNSRSRSRSRDRKHKSSNKKHRRSRSRSKEARRRDSEKASKSHSRLEETPQDERGRERLSEENGEDRHRRKDKKSSRGRSYSRSRSRDRRHRSRSRDKRRSHSRSRDRRSKSRERKRRARSRSRSKHRHRSRSRSKSRERKKRTEKVRRKSRSRTASPPAFRGRNTAMDAQEALARRYRLPCGGNIDSHTTLDRVMIGLERAKKLQEQKEKELLEKQQQQENVAAAAASAPLLSDAVVAAAAASAAAAAAAAAASSSSNPVLNVAALLASGTQVTPQIAMAAQMAALQARTLAETGIAVPSYYNPSAVNPMKFAEQEKKRKLLWQGKKEGDSRNQTTELWEKLSFGNKDQNVKFRKLMGIKNEEEAGPSGSLDEDGLKTLQQQEEMFRNLDVQYEMARSQTHTQRGMGLGFGSAFSSRGMDAL
ncbi:arginine/serine-rich coiled-coil protein 2 isoform X2 [Sardina pilchardus]|uniref:arginine/serine-rich coiled-coil protein 2 isoform X2 n=1 Tax=Sardina pilchardus TaxID=27697 RepID=UPI002E13B0B7